MEIQIKIIDVCMRCICNVISLAAFVLHLQWMDLLIIVFEKSPKKSVKNIFSLYFLWC